MPKETVLCKVFDTLGVERIDMSEFDNRLKYQKIVYLLQSLTGLSLGYGFNWYLKGPYSSPLAHTLYFIQDNPTVYEESKDIKFNQNKEVMNELEKFKEKLGDCFNDPLYLEILASLRYIDIANFNGKGTDVKLKTKLFEVKPYLNTDKNIGLIEKAYKELRNYSVYGTSG